jgi:uncharacterized protein (TIGR03083 family)
MTDSLGPLAAAYAGSRERIGALVTGHRGDLKLVPVPTCPRWSVHDVVAHVSGVVDDVLAGRMDGVATDAWTAAQVSAGRGRPTTELISRWNVEAPAFESGLDAVGRSGHQVVADVATHEHDIRAAIRAPGDRDSDAVLIGLAFMGEAFTRSAQAKDVSVRVEYGTRSHGPDHPEAVLSGEPFELLRALTGRRSVDQILALTWTGDPQAVIDAFTFGPFRPAEQPIHE